MDWPDEVLAGRAGKLVVERHAVCGTCLYRDSVFTESNAAARRHFLIAGWSLTGAHGWICPDCERSRRASAEALTERRRDMWASKTPSAPSYVKDHITEARKKIKDDRRRRIADGMV